MHEDNFPPVRPAACRKARNRRSDLDYWTPEHSPVIIALVPHTVGTAGKMAQTRCFRVPTANTWFCNVHDKSSESLHVNAITYRHSVTDFSSFQYHE